MDEFNSEKENAKEVDTTPVEPNEHVNSQVQENDVQSSSEQPNNDYNFNGDKPNFRANDSDNSYNSYNQSNQNNQTNYYTPPEYIKNVNNVSNNDNSYLNDKPKKEKKKHCEDKKNKILITILAVFVVSAVIALIAISTVLMHNQSVNNGSSNGIFSSDSDKSSTNNEIGEALVQDSQEAAKTDEKGNLTAAGVVQKTIDSCVGIRVYAKSDPYSYFYGYGANEDNSKDGFALSGEGSGVIMSEANGKTYIMTCAHVVNGGSKFVVKTNDGKEYDASLVGADSQTDIGVIAITGTGFKIAEFGNSEDIEIGEECIAIGCPGGLEFMNSATKGIVSALARPISSKIGYDNECIQVDAAINPGNSGGALFNMQGQVIGINSSKIADTNFEGMGFAVPSSTAVDIANSLIKNGYVEGRAKLGIMYNQLSNFSNSKNVLAALEQNGYKDAKGTMVVQSIDHDSTLNGKDIKQYDMIVAVNGETMTSIDVMTNILSKSNPGDKITLTVARAQGNRLEIFDLECELIESKD